MFLTDDQMGVLLLSSIIVLRASELEIRNFNNCIGPKSLFELNRNMMLESDNKAKLLSVASIEIPLL